ncbi:pentatricopeptide repeat-containing protein 1, mitochondrial [Nephila pilipes]|uniref:Pentatricopeptide repeat-containing protein 1, mitochondrial n=1 Tax=Nephila pilipes TaxID=299642 RepID=A0A8X6NZ21_NEPPI|nr:pentatricopeptide repeat-containing protein 1, mitochondrial [Nephila pilipes]
MIVLRHVDETGISSSSDSTNVDSRNVFGSLRKPLEKRKVTFISKTTKDKIDVKVIRIKNRPKFHPSNDPDIFGNLSNKNPVWYSDVSESSAVDNDLSDDSTVIRNISKQYKDPKEYLSKMKSLVSEKKIKEALELFIDMRKNFVTPLHAHYTFMIGACGRFGYTEMAFKLLRQMTDRKFKPTSATLTGLFNSCAENPFPDHGLAKAKFLKEKIKSKNWPLNQITYHSMIKAFGKCGDIQTAFEIVDEMAVADIKIDVSTYCFLLISCIANKEAGFTHAIEVWRKMKKRRCSPDLFAFNLLLRAVRDCDVGPEEISCLLLQHWSNYSKRPYGFKVKEILPQKEILLLQSTEMNQIDSDTQVSINDPIEKKHKTEDSSVNEVYSNAKGSSEQIEPDSYSLPETKNIIFQTKTETSVINKIGNDVPSVLHARPVSCATVMDIGVIKTPSDRLALIGGAENILIDMKKIKVKPNIKTFTLLLESLPSSIEAEDQLMVLLDVYGVKPDIGFFNMLIKKRNFRFDYAAAHAVLPLVNKWSLSPDIITFGVLAVGCTSHRKATIFINDMRKLGYSPNIEIIGALVRNACKCLDFKFMQDTLKLIKELQTYPDERMLKTIECTLEAARNNIIDMEQGKDVSYRYRKEGFTKNYKEFCEIYEEWLKNVKLEKQEHVWDQYRTDIFEKPIKVPSNVQVLE